MNTTHIFTKPIGEIGRDFQIKPGDTIIVKSKVILLDVQGTESKPIKVNIIKGGNIYNYSHSKNTHIYDEGRRVY